MFSKTPAEKIQPLSRQAGQTLILGLSFIAILSVGLYSIFAINRLAQDKNQQINAVDAAAYSGALIQARALNMQAYINLAQIAHQMAMAHLVTLGSWAKFSSTEANQLSRLNPPAYLIGMMFGARHLASYQASAKAFSLHSIANNSNELDQAYRLHDEIVEKVLFEVSQKIHQSFSDVRNNAINEVLKHNFPSLKVIKNESDLFDFSRDIKNTEFNYFTSLGASLSALEWQIKDKDINQFASFFKPSGNYRSLIHDAYSLYPFLHERNYIAKSPWIVSERCPHLRHELRRTGQTVLSEQGLWQSNDTQAFQAIRSNRWIGCYRREYPMGWGMVLNQSDSQPENLLYTENPPDNFAKKNFWKWVQETAQWNFLNTNQNPLTNSYAIRDKQQWQKGGLMPYADINGKNKDNKISFELITFREDVKGMNLYLTSLAESYFERYKARSDGFIEQANLWHPYWLARLTKR